MLAVVHCRLHRLDGDDDDDGYDWLTYMKLTDRIGDLRKRLQRMKRGCETSTYVSFSENSRTKLDIQSTLSKNYDYTSHTLRINLYSLKLTLTHKQDENEKRYDIEIHDIGRRYENRVFETRERRDD